MEAQVGQEIVVGEARQPGGTEGHPGERAPGRQRGEGRAGCKSRTEE